MMGGGGFEKVGAVGLMLLVGVGASPWFWTLNCSRCSISALPDCTALLITGTRGG